MSDDLIRQSDAIRVTEPYKNNIDIIPTVQARLYVREAVEGIRKELLKLPTVEPKHGKWLHYEGELTCSNCGATYYDDIMGYMGDYVPHFCPDCGAEMKGKDDE